MIIWIVGGSSTKHNHHQHGKFTVSWRVHILVMVVAKGENLYGSVQIENIRGNQDLYVQTDVFLIVGVFGNLRKMSANYYGSDPVHYYTLPNFAGGQ